MAIVIGTVWYIWWYVPPEDRVEVIRVRSYTQPAAIEPGQLLDKLHAAGIPAKVPAYSPTLHGPINLGNGMCISSKYLMTLELGNVSAEVNFFADAEQLSTGLSELQRVFSEPPLPRSAWEAHGGGWLQDPFPKHVPKGAYIVVNGLVVLTLDKVYLRFDTSRMLMEAFGKLDLGK